MRFSHSEALRTKTLDVLTTLEQSDDPTAHRDALAKLVVELNDVGMKFYFMEQSANLGMAGAIQVIGSVVRKIIGRMEAPQLLSVCASIRQLMR